MKVEVLESKVNDEIKVGDIFYSEYTGSYVYLTPTHYDDGDGESMYSLIVLSEGGLYYSNKSSNLPLNDLIEVIKKDSDLIHYPAEKYEYTLTIKEMSHSL